MAPFAALLDDLLARATARPWPALASLAAGLALVRYLHSWHHYRTYWSKRGVPGERPWPVFSALYSLLLEDRLASAVAKTRKYGKVHGTFMLGRPQLYIADAEAIRQVAIREFDSFQNHQAVMVGSKYQRNALLWLQGRHWKRVRALMTPSFTSAKMRQMYKLLNGCANDLVQNFREQCDGGGGESAVVDLMAIYGLYTMDGITTCGYGLKLRRSTGDVDIERASTRNQLIRDIRSVLGFKLSRIGLVLVTPARLLEAFNFQLVPESTYAPMVARMRALIRMRREPRQSAAGAKYDDLLQSLVDAKLGDRLELSQTDRDENHHAGLSDQSLEDDQRRLVEISQTPSSLVHDQQQQDQQQQQIQQQQQQQQNHEQQVGLSDDEIIASAIFLMAAGLDTTRASLATISYLLAHHPHVQERLHDELCKLAQGAQGTAPNEFAFDYEALAACKYLDAVVSESLRLFGPSAKTDRCANADFYLAKYGLWVHKGTHLLLGLHAVANDPDYWREPHLFDPERFMPGQRERIVPGSYAPFSMGPRHCLGMRFSLLETKLGLAKVLMEFKFESAPGTRYPPVPTRGISLVAVRDCRVRLVARRPAA